jgi:hypothetical protein
MTSEDENQNVPLVETPEIKRMREERQIYMEGLKPPFSDEERSRLSEFDRTILEATAQQVQLRQQQKEGEQG